MTCKFTRLISFTQNVYYLCKIIHAMTRLEFNFIRPILNLNIVVEAQLLIKQRTCCSIRPESTRELMRSADMYDANNFLP